MWPNQKNKCYNDSFIKSKKKKNVKSRTNNLDIFNKI